MLAVHRRMLVGVVGSSEPIRIRSITHQAGTSNPIAVTTSESPEPTEIGDLVLVVHGNDFYTFATMGTPSATGAPVLTEIVDARADGGVNLAHIRAYTYVANTAGAQVVSVTEGGAGDEDKDISVIVFANADTASPVDDAAANTDPDAETFQISPAVNPSTEDAYLVTLNNSGGGGSTTGYTTPAGLTKEYQYQVGGISGFCATKQLAASGDTGSFTTQADGSTRYAAVTIAIKTA